ncbi:MAG TPA: hypothetical protein VGG42_07245 [Acidobacteriaceae bacterium]|jgi:anti-sigma factor RsiW
MNFRRDEAQKTEAVESREEVRELAEALSLYRSAVTHLASRSAAQPRLAVPRSAPPFRLRLLLGPALGAALAAGILFPLYGHLHHSHAVVLQPENTPVPDPSTARASVDDTVLMNQIDTQLSESVPDALEPLAALSAQAASQSSVSEKKQ